MTINQFIRYAIAYLNHHKPQNDDRHHRDVMTILKHRLQLSLAQLILMENEKIKLLDVLYQDIRQRAKGFPVAYIIQKKDFWSLSLYVEQGVFIPRPDTESIIESCLQDQRKELHVLDLGTGTGALALSLAKTHPSWHILACDCSHRALRVAHYNQKSLNLDIQLQWSRWFLHIKKKFHLIVSNPPYIAPWEKENAAYEPQKALFSPMGFMDLQHIIQQSPYYLLPGGKLYVEHSPMQANLIRRFFSKRGYRQITQIVDLSQHKRITTGTY